MNFIDPWEPTHKDPPSTTNYHRGCRCGGCRAAKCERAMDLRRVRMAKRVLENGRLVAPIERHGVMSTYVNWGCRCVPCSDNHSNYHREYRRLRKAARET